MLISQQCNGSASSPDSLDSGDYNRAASSRWNPLTEEPFDLSSSTSDSVDYDGAASSRWNPSTEEPFDLSSSSDESINVTRTREELSYDILMGSNGSAPSSYVNFSA